MQQIPKGLLDKLNKLKALEEGAQAVGSTHEAENASAKYQAILLEYNLTDQDVQKSSIEAKIKVLMDDFDVTGFFAWKASGWVEKLVRTICRHSFCETVTNYNSTRVHIIGEKDNVAMVFYFVEQLVEKIKVAYNIAWKEYEGTENMKLFRRGFLTGAVDAINSRLYKESIQAINVATVANPGLALVLKSKKDIVKAKKDELFNPDLLSKVRSGFSSSKSGYVSGHQAGSGLSLNRGKGKSQKYLE